MVAVIKRDGRKEPLDITKIHKNTSAATLGLAGVSHSELEVDANLHFIDGITSIQIQQTLIKSAVDKIDIDAPNWTFVAARLFLYDLYHRVGKSTNGKKGVPYGHLKDYIEYAQSCGRIVEGIQDGYDLDDLDSTIDRDRDNQFTYLGIKTLYDRYLIKDSSNNPIELPQHMFMAIAMFLAQNEDDKQSRAKEFYNVISKFEVMVATPTLSNARTPRHQLSSCYIGSTPDNIEGIFDSYKEMALLSKFGGGIGWDWSNVRSQGSYIDNHKNAAGGTIPFLKITNDIALAVDQLGCVAKDSYVKVLKSVTTNNFTHDFRREYSKADFTKRELLEDVASFASSFAFEYGKFSKNFIGSLIFDYIMNLKEDKFLEDSYDLSHEQYKEIINKYQNISKGLPCGFETIIEHCEYAISKDGVILRVDSLRPLNDSINRKGYQFVSIGKKQILVHRLLAKQFLNYDNSMIIDHIDGNKLNNSLDNLDLISSEKSISKGFRSSHKKRAEISRVRNHLSSGVKLNGEKRDTHKVKILDIQVDTISISNVRSGDLILSYDSNSKSIRYKTVTVKHKIDVKVDNQIKLVFENGNYIITSNWHPFPKLKRGNLIYVRSDEIVEGDDTINEKGESVKVVSISKANESEEFYDLTVKDTNNYFCSTHNSIDDFHLIHNTRKGAIAVYLEPWHIDVLDFIDLKKNAGEERRRAHDLFPALWISDLFMKRVMSDEEWTLFDPYETKELIELTGDEFESKYIEFELNPNLRKISIKAKDLWKRVLLSYFESGSPFLCFKDSANRSNPNSHKGLIRSSNLCTEIYQNTNPNHYKIKALFEDGSYFLFDEDDSVTLSDGRVKKANKLSALDEVDNKKIYIVEKESIAGETAVCNLASINLSRINSLDDIKRVAPIAIRMLDNVIDLNFYPLKKVKDTNRLSRSIGLGVMGEAQMLAENSIEWGSQEHFLKVDEIMEAVSFYAIKSSSDLAKEKGIYPNFEGSNWSKGIMPIDVSSQKAKELTNRDLSLDWDYLREFVKSNGMRNGYLMAIAPTSSISILAGTTQAIEPIYKKKWFEENLSGLIPVVAPNISPDTWNYYPSAYDLDQRLLIKAGAIRQKWIDQGQSLNIFVRPNNISGKDLHEIYMMAWELGLKSTYYLRSQSPEANNDIEDRSMECVGCQ